MKVSEDFGPTMQENRAKPRVEIEYVDNTDTDGYLRIIVNGFVQPSIMVKVEPENEAVLHMGLRKVLEHVYDQAYKDSERAARQRVRSLMDWAKSP